MGKIAIYPGSFDPLTNGHFDIIKRGVKLFDKVIVTILHNTAKKSLFTVEERIELIKNSLEDFNNIEVTSYDGLLVDYAKLRNVDAIIRGMRAVSDFENEFQMALINRRLNRDVQTIFLMTGLRWIFTSSSLIKEVAMFNGDISGMVPPAVCKKLKEKFSTNNAN
ncbi:MAG: pantetheine-phosphate adenylyltransferase [Desulfobacteraceae bacterium 4572_19]|nr:MAG: pantetheine-phosphate adenylyltransferase [Desulfobacteraceae bacterium 4572_19]